MTGCPGELTRYSFVCEWFDEKAELMKQYLMTYHTCERLVEMYDIKNRRVFLKKTPVDIRVADLYLGNSLNIFARHFTLVEYGDGCTRQQMAFKFEMTFGLLENPGLKKVGALFQFLTNSGLGVTKARMVNIEPLKLKTFYETETREPGVIGSEDPKLKSPVLVFEIRGRNAVVKWQTILRREVTKTGADTDCLMLKEILGNDLQNYVHGPSASAFTTIAQEYKHLFYNMCAPHCDTPTFQYCTLCLVKPHALKEGKAGAIIQKILDRGYDITALEMFTLNKATVDEFYEIYKGVVVDFPYMVEELISGPCIALEISSCTCLEKTAQEFREFVGPTDSEMARCVRPGTVRADFGVDKIKNAVHCTDLPEDGLLEVEYFFKVLCCQLP